MSNDRLFKPLVLVSQIQRSGGSMVAQLFDNHPQCYAHPFEIHMGFPQKWDWPEFDFSDGPQAELWFSQLYEKKLKKFIKEGFFKAGSNPYAFKERFPFNFSIDNQLKIFAGIVNGLDGFSVRHIIDAYFMSFFEAWENHQETGDERVITGFTPPQDEYDHSES